MAETESTVRAAGDRCTATREAPSRKDTYMRSPDDFDFLDPETVEAPYPFYAALREHAPVYQVPGTDVYLVSKRHLIEEALDRVALRHQVDVCSGDLVDRRSFPPSGVEGIRVVDGFGGEEVEIVR